MRETTDLGSLAEYSVLVPLSNPESEADLVSLGAAIANQRDGSVVAVSMVEVPDQTPLDVARERFDFDASRAVLRGAERSAAERGVRIRTHVVFTHNVFEAIFDAARRYDVDACLMGWGPKSPGVGGRAESISEELADSLPCDFLVFKHRGFDPSRILLPTTGGPHTDLAALVASVLRAEFGSSVTLLHVTDDESAGRAFLAEWAEDHHLGDVDQRVASGPIGDAIAAAAADHTMILIGATDAGVLYRLAHRSLTIGVLEDVDCSVLITEKRSRRGLMKRLFGRG